MSLADLRALALGRGTKLHPLPLMLDDEIRQNLVDAQDALVALLAARKEMTTKGDLPAKKPESLADEPVSPTADIDHMITATRETIEAIQAQAVELGKVVVVQFRPLSPAAYRAIRDKHEREARKATKDDPRLFPEVYHAGLLKELMEACYIGCFTPGPDDDLSGGENLQITLDQLRTDVLTDGDLTPDPAEGPIMSHLMRVNRGVAVVPFLPASSGQPATS